MRWRGMELWGNLGETFVEEFVSIASSNVLNCEIRTFTHFRIQFDVRWTPFWDQCGLHGRLGARVWQRRREIKKCDVPKGDEVENLVGRGGSETAVLRTPGEDKQKEGKIEWLL